MRVFFQKLAIPALLVCFMFISGCTWMRNRAECASPYVTIGNQCCLDQNNNSICDENEMQVLKNNSDAAQPGTLANHSGNFSNTPCPLPGEFVEFYGEGCPHCTRMIPVVSAVENETGVRFRKLEVWYNKTNNDEIMKYKEHITRDCGALGVPAFISLKTNRSVCGEMSKEELKRFINDNIICETIAEK